MEAVDDFDTAEGVKLIEEGILLPFWVVLVKLGDSDSLSSGVWLDQADVFQVGAFALLSKEILVAWFCCV
jgi:hypothetical protein